jgi:hypothetical protein
MFAFTFLAEVNPKSEIALDPELKDVAGAYAVILVHFKECTGAEVLAKHYIKKNGWKVKKRTRVSEVSKADCTTPERQEYYAEAMKYGYSLAFHMWGKDADDANRDYEKEERKKERKAKS